MGTLQPAEGGGFLYDFDELFDLAVEFREGHVVGGRARRMLEDGGKAVNESLNRAYAFAKAGWVKYKQHETEQHRRTMDTNDDAERR